MSRCLGAAAVVLGLAIFLAIGFRSQDRGNAVRGQTAGTQEIGQQPVEKETHEFMEYLFEPAYKRLKAAMAGPPRDNAGWKAIKSDSLLLAEGANLLFLRVPDEEANSWKEHAAAVRRFGGQVYQAAKKKDYSAARQHYVAMINACNRCHQEFAHGEHQLKP